MFKHQQAPSKTITHHLASPSTINHCPASRMSSSFKHRYSIHSSSSIIILQYILKNEHSLMCTTVLYLIWIRQKALTAQPRRGGRIEAVDLDRFKRGNISRLFYIGSSNGAKVLIKQLSKGNIKEFVDTFAPFIRPAKYRQSIPIVKLLFSCKIGWF